MNNEMTDQNFHQRQLHIPDEDNAGPSENGILTKNSTLIVKKKEKSRDAARSRRGKENYEFYELAKLLPIPSETSSQLDKASIVRLTMSFLQLHNFLKSSYNWKKQPATCETESKPNTQETKNTSMNISIDASNYVEKNYGALTLQSLDGFIIILNKCGRFLYVSSTVSIYLGLAQVDLVGTSIFTYTHPSDHSELNEYFKRKSPRQSNQSSRSHQRSLSDENGKDLKTSTCSFFVRMKSTLSRRGMGVKSSGYKVVHISGGFNTEHFFDEADKDDQCQPPEVVLGFAGIAQVLPPPALVDVKLDNPMFVSRLDPSLHVTYCENSIKDLTCYDVDELVGESWYKFVSNPDLDKMRSCHMEMLSKGQVVTPYYRWLLKSGASIWVQSNVTIVVDKNLNTDEDSFVWITYILGDEHQSYLAKACGNASGEENENNEEILGSGQKETPTFQKDVAVKLLNNGVALKPEKIEAGIQVCEKKTTTCPMKRPLPEKLDLSKNDQCEQAPPVPKKEKIYKSHKIANKESRTSKTISEKVPKSSKKEQDTEESSIHDSYWFNPPNREVSNHSDLPPGIKVQDFHLGNPLITARTSPTVIHHHYPFGINPNLLNSNPVLAKMIRTANYVVNEPLFSAGDAYILAPQMNFFPQILAPVPNLIASRPNNMGSCCPSSLSAIIDELRKDPMRKVNPPNKVVLPSSKSPTSSNNSLAGELQKTSSSMIPHPRHSLLNLTSMSNSGVIMQPLARYNCAAPANPIILQPLLHNSSLPI